MAFTTKGLKTTLVLVVSILSFAATAQPADRADKWQPIISELRSCVRSNAPLAQAAGIEATNDAVEFFGKRCNIGISNIISATDLSRMVPDRLRIVVENEWEIVRQRDGADH